MFVINGRFFFSHLVGFRVQTRAVQQAGYISGSPNLAYTTGHVASAAGGESVLYFTKTSV